MAENFAIFDSSKEIENMNKFFESDITHADAEVSAAIDNEARGQMGSVFTNKYAEGCSFGLAKPVERKVVETIAAGISASSE